MSMHANAMPPKDPRTLAAKRARGRPKGSKTRTLRHDGALGVHHFAFLRCWFLGLDLRDAWRRYMAFAELSDDLRHVEHRRAALLGQVLDAGHQLNLALAPERQITRQLELLAREPFSPSKAPLPSLDDFIDAQALDREFYSEAELLREYRDFYHLDTVTDGQNRQDGPAPGGPSVASSPAEVQVQVHALNQLQTLLAHPPEACDRLDRWLCPALCQRLKTAGIGSLGALAGTVRVHGYNWFTRAPGLGATRARCLVDWLAPLAAGFGQPIPEHALAAPQRQRALRGSTLSKLVIPTRFGIVALAGLAVPPALAGRVVGGQSASGRFATNMPNHLGAADDLQALQAWLKTYEESKPTHRAYAKEVERFYLWCLHERQKPLSSIDSMDCLAYREFLNNLPPAWINPAPTPKLDPAWRPFRGPLSTRSQKYALVVIQALFDGLASANYLVGNPMKAINKNVNTRQGGSPLERSFTDNEWAFVLTQVGAVQDKPDTVGGRPRAQAEALRIRLILEMLASTGLRLAEIAGATLDAISEVRVDGELETALVIKVLGKGNKQREVPVGDDIMVLIRQHHAHAAAIAPLPCPAPIICTLGKQPQKWLDGEDGAVRLEPKPTPAVRALSSTGLYLTLKRFFRRISQQAFAVDGLSRERFLAASTHWLRHTFGRRGAAAGVPIEVLRQAFGHASLNTTSVYVTTERSRMITELRRMKKPPGVA